MDSSVQEIKDKLSINEVVGGYVKLQRAGRNFRARCPFHNERTPSFNVSPERGSYICFGCGEKGDIFSFVQKIEGIDFPTALKQLAEKAGVTLKHDFVPVREHKERDERLRDVCEEATRFFEKKLQEKKDVLGYLHSRAVTDATVAEWRIGYAPASWRDLTEYLSATGFTKDEIVDAGLSARSERKPGEIYDRFRGRIMFPLCDAGGKVIAFSGRFFEKVEGSKEEGDPAKYVNSPETDLFKKSRVLFGYDKAKNIIRKTDCILLVEGQFDVVMSHQSGLPFAVALSGTALTQEHLSLLGRLSKRLVLALDADAAGMRAGQKSAMMAYAAGFDVKVPALHGGKDPADIAKDDPEALKAAVRTSRTAIEFFLDALRPSARDDRAYKKMVEMQIIPLVSVLQSKIDQEHFIRIIASAIRVPEEAVRSEVAKKRALQADTPVFGDSSPSAETSSAPSKLERAVCLLLFSCSSDEKVKSSLVALIGNERLAQIEEKNSPDAERSRFDFEALSDDVNTSIGLLLVAIEKSVIEEKIAALRASLREADPLTQLEQMKKIETLKRREQELRK